MESRPPVKILRLSPFRQTSLERCGPACLRMLVGFYGVEKTEATLARVCRTNRKFGTSIENLVRAVKQLGFAVEQKDGATLLDLENYVRQKKRPVIVEWFSIDDGHYSVVVGIDKANIILLDPEIGQCRKIAREKFLRLWFGFRGDFIKDDKRNLSTRRMIVIYPKNPFVGR